MDLRHESTGLDNLAFDMNEQINNQSRGKADKLCRSSCVAEDDGSKPAYCVTDVPPWYLCAFLAIQHYLTAFGALITIPLILSEGLCLQHDSLTQSRLINTIFFVSGLCTLLQVTFGVRLPILQGGTFALVTPAMAMLSMPEWKCPAWTQNASLVNTSSPLFIDVWQTRMRTILVGFSGLIGFLMRFIGPLTIAPTISLIGLSLYDSAGVKAGSHWGISAISEENKTLLKDGDFSVITNLTPHAGQWGMPTVNLAGVIGILAGIICSMAESVGDYHACARLSGAPNPPKHAINRGIGVEGLGSLLAGAFGTGNGTTSFSENVAAIGITKVGSRKVILLSGVFMILIGTLGKIGAIFTTIPAPVIGGMFLVMFAVITATGISNLQSTDMNSSRNIFVFGFSIFSALVIPNWIMKNPNALATGTKRERGLLSLDKADLEDSGNTFGTEDIYDLPFGMSACLSSRSWVRYIPFCPLKDSRSLYKSKDHEDISQSQKNNLTIKVTDESSF
ncbi:Solute carrier family 23 member 1 [Channa argus]|uniref:Solute carrier family 23 member 1 n=1 Tax=Channa argus TaxID=215402 RepID=A0A6G1QKM9_CHAAH|nr:Solute carrier family 23 member 1 [Channa argus]